VKKLLMIGFFGAMIGATVGIGTGSIFNPVFISLDLHPAVGSATGMYLTQFVTLSATIVQFIQGNIDPYYFLTLGVFVIAGSFPGLRLQIFCVAKSGRPYTTVMILQFWLIFFLVAVPTVNILALVH